GDVTVTPTAADSARLTVTGALTFGTTSWNTAQTVTITANADDDNTDDTTTITHAVTGYGNVTAGDVTVTITDTGGVPTFGETTVSDQTYDTGNVIPVLTLPAATGGDGTLSYALTGAIPDGLAFDANARTLTGTPTTAAAAVTLTYTVTDSDTNTADTDAATLSFAVTVVVAPGVVLTPTALTVSEGMAGHYTVVLTMEPNGDVTVTPQDDMGGEATVSGALTFSTANWSMAQTVTVTGVADDDLTTDTGTLTHTVAGYGSLTAAGSVVVTVTDTRGLPTFDGAQVPGRFYPVNLAIPALTLPRAIGGDGALSYDLIGALPAGLTLTAFTVAGTPTDTSTLSPYTWRVTDEAMNTASLQFSLGVYMTICNRTMQVRDAIALAATRASCAAVTPTDLGAIDDLTVADDTNLTALLSGDLAGLSGLEDLDLSGNRISALPEGLFDGVGPLTSLRLHGNQVDPLPLGIELEQLSDGRFRVQIAEATPLEVAVTWTAVGVAGGTSGSVGGSAGAAGGAAGATGGVTGAVGAADTGTATIPAGQRTSEAFGMAMTNPELPVLSDPNFPGAGEDTEDAGGDYSGFGLRLPAGTATPGVTIRPTALTVQEAGTGIYEVFLIAPPAADVTITPTVAPVGVVTLSGALTFSTATWNQVQTVTITTPADDDTEGATATISHAVSGYGSVTASEVTVTVEDTNGVPTFGETTVADQTYTAGTG
ncbi:MAG: leucine-rich repeat domain-containing protein, partial [Gammaproteobacteria bacterium]|nr:leucine-rich repeat domain-containing protein [Gammaproteobacteria bacterium]